MWERALLPTNNILIFYIEIIFWKMMGGNAVNSHGILKRFRFCCYGFDKPVLEEGQKLQL
jgi:hypothetical protein